MVKHQNVSKYYENDYRLVELEDDVTNKEGWLKSLEKFLILDVPKFFPSLIWTEGHITMMAKKYTYKVEKPGKATCSVCKGALID